VLEVKEEFDINSILKELPPSLKSEMLLFLYHEAIDTIPFLQFRPQEFYLQYLDKLEPLKFKAGTQILKAHTRPEEVFFILKGEVYNEVKQRVFVKGSILGVTDIIRNRVS